LKGSLNEYELDLLRQRSLEARREKARRGELLVTPSVGCVKTEAQHWEKDPDRRVQQAVLLVFRKFLKLGTVRQAFLWFLEQDVQLPAYTQQGETSWKRPSYSTIYSILTNPIYGGAYAYGKTERTLHYGNGVQRRGTRRKLREQWLTLMPNTHEGYVSWEQHQQIQRAIAENARGFRTICQRARRRRFARRSVALSTVWCRRSSCCTQETNMMYSVMCVVAQGLNRELPPTCFQQLFSI
jgi:hypothetical protein